MNNNEIIAEWLDYRLGEDAIVGGWSDGSLTVGSPLPPGGRFTLWSPDTDIAVWHGEDGLLKKIEERLGRQNFMIELGKVCGVDTQWAVTELEDGWLFMASTPSQLTEALVATIREVGDED